MEQSRRNSVMTEAPACTVPTDVYRPLIEPSDSQVHLIVQRILSFLGLITHDRARCMFEFVFHIVLESCV